MEMIAVILPQRRDSMWDVIIGDGSPSILGYCNAGIFYVLEDFKSNIRVALMAENQNQPPLALGRS